MHRSREQGPASSLANTLGDASFPLRGDPFGLQRRARPGNIGGIGFWTWLCQRMDRVFWVSPSSLYQSRPGQLAARHVSWKTLFSTLHCRGILRCRPCRARDYLQQPCICAMLSLSVPLVDSQSKHARRTASGNSATLSSICVTLLKDSRIPAEPFCKNSTH